MRKLILLVTFLFLTACQRNAEPDINCSMLNLEDMTPQQRVHALGFCEEQFIAQKNDSMMGRLSNQAEIMRQPTNEFVKTRVGQIALYKEIASVVVGLLIVIVGWALALIFFRRITWTEETATRKSWGPFSFWEIRYRRRNDEFMDIGPTGWFFIICGIGGLVSLFIYITISK